MKDQNAFKIMKEITRDVMAAIESGSLEKWVKPWQLFGFPKNVCTSKEYGIFNSFHLTKSLVDCRFSYSTWGTIKQWNSLNYQIKEGEISKAAVLFPMNIQIPVKSKKKRKQEESDKEPVRYKSYLAFKAYPVYNIEQANVKESDYPFFVTEVHSKGLDRIDAFVNAIEHNVGDSWSNKAAYVIGSDSIIMPPKEHFRRQDDYWSTYLHELGHWTGAKHRLNRNLQMDESSYAFEELVAELCSAIFAGEFGLSGQLQHKQYIQSWIELIEKNPRIILKAGRLAMEAVDYLKVEASKAEWTEKRIK
ncbi:DUF1738 domain-containing protein [Leptospira bourretii]|uniref:ArdC family protein n=1 Tax=Leptospira bourretii TaxID=2484962 RepID=UPI0010917A3E|nr:zincin-like metallopeptidase domain-containing protein [Leptospira bourretii]TGL17378.1 DUF1738 domain-containing protein [Leptospira bourretii]